MAPAKVDMGALMAKAHDNGTKRIGMAIAIISLAFVFLTCFTGIIIYASDIKACAERGHVRIDSMEKNIDDIKINVRDIKNHLMSPKKK